MIYTFFKLLFELCLLFFLINSLVSLLLSRYQDTLVSKLFNKSLLKSAFFALLLACLTPFCSCSSIPLLRGLIRLKAPCVSVLLFLFCSPLINPIVIFMLASFFSLGFAFFYLLFVALTSLLLSFILDTLNFSRYFKKAAFFTTKPACACKKSIMLKSILKDSFKELLSLLPYLLIACLIGAAIHNYLPKDFLLKTLGSHEIISIPLASIIATPLYLRASFLVPIVASLLESGLGLGVCFALLVGGSGISLPELVLLKSLFKAPLLGTFILAVLCMAVFGGYFVKYFLMYF